MEPTQVSNQAQTLPSQSQDNLPYLEKRLTEHQNSRQTLLKTASIPFADRVGQARQMDDQIRDLKEKIAAIKQERISGQGSRVFATDYSTRQSQNTLTENQTTKVTRFVNRNDFRSERGLGGVTQFRKKSSPATNLVRGDGQASNQIKTRVLDQSKKDQTLLHSFNNSGFTNYKGDEISYYRDKYPEGYSNAQATTANAGGNVFRTSEKILNRISQPKVTGEPLTRVVETRSKDTASFSNIKFVDYDGFGKSEKSGAQTRRNPNASTNSRTDQTTANGAQNGNVILQNRTKLVESRVIQNIITDVNREEQANQENPKTASKSITRELKVEDLSDEELMRRFNLIKSLTYAELNQEQKKYYDEFYKNGNRVGLFLYSDEDTLIQNEVNRRRQLKETRDPQNVEVHMYEKRYGKTIIKGSKILSPGQMEQIEIKESTIEKSDKKVTLKEEEKNLRGSYVKTHYRKLGVGAFDSRRGEVSNLRKSTRIVNIQDLANASRLDISFDLSGNSKFKLQQVLDGKGNVLREEEGSRTISRILDPKLGQFNTETDPEFNTNTEILKEIREEARATEERTTQTRPEAVVPGNIGEILKRDIQEEKEGSGNEEEAQQERETEAGIQTEEPETEILESESETIIEENESEAEAEEESQIMASEHRRVMDSFREALIEKYVQEGSVKSEKTVLGAEIEEKLVEHLMKTFHKDSDLISEKKAQIMEEIKKGVISEYLGAEDKQNAETGEPAQRDPEVADFVITVIKAEENKKEIEIEAKNEDEEEKGDVTQEIIDRVLEDYVEEQSNVVETKETEKIESREKSTTQVVDIVTESVTQEGSGEEVEQVKEAKPESQEERSETQEVENVEEEVVEKSEEIEEESEVAKEEEEVTEKRETPDIKKIFTEGEREDIAVAIQDIVELQMVKDIQKEIDQEELEEDKEEQEEESKETEVQETRVIETTTTTTVTETTVTKEYVNEDQAEEIEEVKEVEEVVIEQKEEEVQQIEKEVEQVQQNEEEEELKKSETVQESQDQDQSQEIEVEVSKKETETVENEAASELESVKQEEEIVVEEESIEQTKTTRKTDTLEVVIPAEKTGQELRDRSRSLQIRNQLQNAPEINLTLKEEGETFKEYEERLNKEKEANEEKNRIEPVSERESEQVSLQQSQVTSQIRSQVTEQRTEQVSEQVTEQVSEQASEQVSEQVNEQVSEQASEQVTEQVTEQVSEQVSEKVTEQVTKTETYRSETRTETRDPAPAANIGGNNYSTHNVEVKSRTATNNQNNEASENQSQRSQRSQRSQNSRHRGPRIVRRSHHRENQSETQSYQSVRSEQRPAPVRYVLNQSTKSTRVRYIKKDPYSIDSGTRQVQSGRRVENQFRSENLGNLGYNQESRNVNMHKKTEVVKTEIQTQEQPKTSNISSGLRSILVSKVSEEVTKSGVGTVSRIGQHVPSKNPPMPAIMRVESTQAKVKEPVCKEVQPGVMVCTYETKVEEITTQEPEIIRCDLQPQVYTDPSVNRRDECTYIVNVDERQQGSDASKPQSEILEPQVCTYPVETRRDECTYIVQTETVEPQVCTHNVEPRQDECTYIVNVEPVEPETVQPQVCTYPLEPKQDECTSVVNVEPVQPETVQPQVCVYPLKPTIDESTFIVNVDEQQNSRQENKLYETIELAGSVEDKNMRKSYTRVKEGNVFTNSKILSTNYKTEIVRRSVQRTEGESKEVNRRTYETITQGQALNRPSQQREQTTVKYFREKPVIVEKIVEVPYTVYVEKRVPNYIRKDVVTEVVVEKDVEQRVEQEIEEIEEVEIENTTHKERIMEVVEEREIENIKQVEVPASVEFEERQTEVVQQQITTRVEEQEQVTSSQRPSGQLIDRVNLEGEDIDRVSEHSQDDIIVRNYYVRRPQNVYRDKIVEEIVEIEKEVFVDKEVIREVIKDVPREEVNIIEVEEEETIVVKQDKIVDVEKEVEYEKIVKVLKPRIVRRVVEVDVDVEKEVLECVEVPVYRDKEVIVEKYVDIPNIIEKQVVTEVDQVEEQEREEVYQKIIEKERPLEVNITKLKPKYKEIPIERYQDVEKTVYVNRAQEEVSTVNRTRDVRVIREVEKIVHRPRIVERIVEKEYEQVVIKEVPTYRDRIQEIRVPVIVEKIVNVPYKVYRDIPVIKVVEKVIEIEIIEENPIIVEDDIESVKQVNVANQVLTENLRDRKLQLVDLRDKEENLQRELRRSHKRNENLSRDVPKKTYQYIGKEENKELRTELTRLHREYRDVVKETTMRQIEEIRHSEIVKVIDKRRMDPATVEQLKKSGIIRIEGEEIVTFNAGQSGSQATQEEGETEVQTQFNRNNQMPPHGIQVKSWDPIFDVQGALRRAREAKEQSNNENQNTEEEEQQTEAVLGSHMVHNTEEIVNNESEKMTMVGRQESNGNIYPEQGINSQSNNYQQQVTSSSQQRSIQRIYSKPLTFGDNISGTPSVKSVKRSIKLDGYKSKGVSNIVSSPKKVGNFKKVATTTTHYISSRQQATGGIQRTMTAPVVIRKDNVNSLAKKIMKYQN